MSRKSLTRKQRKQQRKLKTVPVEATAEEVALMKEFAREMTRMPRDRSKDNQVFFRPEYGCYDFVGGVQYCKDCFYNYNKTYCPKMREAIL